MKEINYKEKFSNDVLTNFMIDMKEKKYYLKVLDKFFYIRIIENLISNINDNGDHKRDIIEKKNRLENKIEGYFQKLPQYYIENPYVFLFKIYNTYCSKCGDIKDLVPFGEGDCLCYKIKRCSC